MNHKYNLFLSYLIKAKDLTAFTIVELLIVMAIIGILSTMGVGGLYSSLKTQEIIQSNRQLLQDIRRARSQSLILKRDPSENWIYGVGVDLSSISAGNNSYSVFKFLSSTVYDYDAYPVEVQGGRPSGPFNGNSTNYKTFGDKTNVKLPARPKALNLQIFCGAEQDINEIKNPYIVFENQTAKIHIYSYEIGQTSKEVCLSTNINSKIVILMKNNLLETRIIIDRTADDDIYQKIGI